jgi:hypothetical protein
MVSEILYQKIFFILHNYEQSINSYITNLEKKYRKFTKIREEYSTNIRHISTQYACKKNHKAYKMLHILNSDGEKTPPEA